MKKHNLLRIDRSEYPTSLPGRNIIYLPENANPFWAKSFFGADMTNYGYCSGYIMDGKVYLMNCMHEFTETEVTWLLSEPCVEFNPADEADYFSY